MPKKPSEDFPKEATTTTDSKKKPLTPLEKLEKQQEEIKAKIKKHKDKERKIANQKLARQKQNERKLDTRRKILIGATLMNEAETDPTIDGIINSLLDRYLTREDDRKLFPVIPSVHRQDKAEAKRQQKKKATA